MIEDMVNYSWGNRNYCKKLVNLYFSVKKLIESGICYEDIKYGYLENENVEFDYENCPEWKVSNNYADFASLHNTLRKLQFIWKNINLYCDFHKHNYKTFLSKRLQKYACGKTKKWIRMRLQEFRTIENFHEDMCYDRWESSWDRGELIPGIYGINKTYFIAD